MEKHGPGVLKSSEYQNIYHISTWRPPIANTGKKCIFVASHGFNISSSPSSSRTPHPNPTIKGIFRGAPQPWDLLMVKLDPYHSHIFRDSYGSDMGMIWDTCTTSCRSSAQLQASCYSAPICYMTMRSKSLPRILSNGFPTKMEEAPILPRTTAAYRWITRCYLHSGLRKSCRKGSREAFWNVNYEPRGEKTKKTEE